MPDSPAAGLSWEQAFTAGPETCGGKGYNLGRLHRYGFRVPLGGVIPAGWYEEALKVAPGRALEFLRGVPGEDSTEPTVLSALDEVRSALETSVLPASLDAALREFLEQQGLAGASVAVRSSATAEDSARASFAGIHRSFLHVRGVEAIVGAILGCYASLWTPQALAYRRRMNFGDHEVLCAVVICEMVHARDSDEPHSAGVGFTFDPVSGRRDLIVIDAARGIGEAVVSGSVDPQRIVFRNIKGRLHFDSRSGDAALLPAACEQELAHQLFRLHWTLGDGQDPQDVEWAYDGRQIWFLQARPATNVRPFVPAAIAALPRYWSTANIKDAVPGVVCALTWSLLKDSVDALAFAAPISTGYQIPHGAELVRRFKGRGYFDLTLMQWVLYDSLGVLPSQVVQSIGGHQPEIPVPGDPLKGPDGRRRMLAALRLLRKLWSNDRELDRIIRSRDAATRKIRALDLTQLSAADLLAIFQQLEFDHDSLDIVVGLANSAEGPWELALEAALKPVFGDKARSVLGKLLAGTGSVTSAEHGYAIFQLAAAARMDPEALAWLQSQGPATEWVNLPASSAFRLELAHFLEQYGHRGVYEADYLNPRWEEDPSYILDQVRFLLANPQTAAPREAARRVRQEAETAVRQGAGWRTPIIFWLARKLQGGMAVRERAKSALAAPGLPAKRVALEIGRRLVEAGHLDEPQHVVHLAFAEIICYGKGWWDGTGARELSGYRARQREAWLAEDPPPDVIAEQPDGRVSAPAVMAKRQGEVWSGIGAAPGRARGVARIIRHPDEAHTLRKGEVLVAPSTDPGWTPLFLRASAIVMASGGYLSHGAIVAREYGIPAVVNLPGILEDLRSGDLLVVDGDAGLVHRLSPL